jgi:hypothetical protein
VGKITYTAAGVATGPYPGTFTETGTIEFGGGGFGGVTRVQVNFHIESPLAEIDGRKFITARTGNAGCYEYAGNYYAQADATVRYEAIVKPDAGGSYADEGTSGLTVTSTSAQNPALVDVETSTGYVIEQFASQLPQVQPLLPDAKEQCKDQGFLMFGVFENQGDCVSFVTTHGRNEPKNEPPPPPPPVEGPDSVVGSGTFLLNGDVATFSIDAHALAPSSSCAAATGTYSLQSPNYTLEATITELIAEGPDGSVVGTVTSSSDPSIVGYHFQGSFYDGGPPTGGTSPDRTSFISTYPEAVLVPCERQGPDRQVLTGDVVVVDAPPSTYTP